MYRIIYRTALVRRVLGTWSHHNGCRGVAMSTIGSMHYCRSVNYDDDGCGGGGDSANSCATIDCRKFYVYVLNKNREKIWSRNKTESHMFVIRVCNRNRLHTSVYRALFGRISSHVWRYVIHCSALQYPSSFLNWEKEGRTLTIG